MINRTAKTIVERIISDIEDRAGLGNEWGNINNETKKEIKEEWIAIVDTVLTRPEEIEGWEE